jgi:hypothetical protein
VLGAGPWQDIAALFVDTENIVRNEAPFEQIVFAMFGRNVAVIDRSIFPKTQNRIPNLLICDRSRSGMPPAPIKLYVLEIGERGRLGRSGRRRLLGGGLGRCSARSRSYKYGDSAQVRGKACQLTRIAHH